MSVNSADIEQIVRQVIGQMQGTAAAPKKSGKYYTVGYRKARKKQLARPQA